MAIEKEDFEAFTSWKKSTDEASKSIKNFHDHLTGALDISRQLSKVYDKIEDRIQDVNRDLDITRKQIGDHRTAIQANLAEYENIGDQIEKNRQEMSTYLTDELKFNSDIEKIKNKIKDVEHNRLITAGTLERVERDIKSNADARLEIDKKSIANLVKQQDLENEIKQIEADALKNGGISADVARTLVEKGKELSKVKMQGNVLAMKNMQFELKHGQLVEERVKLHAREIAQNEDLDRLKGNLSATESNMAEAQKKRIELEEKNVSFAKRQNAIIKDNESRETSIGILKERENKLIGIRNKLYAQLNLAKMVELAYDRFVQLDAAAESFRKETGFSSDQMRVLRKDAEAINVQFSDMGVSIEKVYASAKALTDVFGRTSLLSKETLKNVSLLSTNLGVAEVDSANVLSMFQGLGGATEEAAMNVIKVGAGISEKAGVPFSMVMKDIANASEQTTALIGANPSKLMKSAIAARALGTDLNKIVSSQRKLLDFSSSINDELEASAMLGKNISFQKARQLAYEGDIEGAAKATLETVKAAGDFDKMSVYQREALAKASGMELKDLTKMLAVEKQRDAILYGADREKAKKLMAQEEELKKLKEINDLNSQDLVAQQDKAIMQERMQGIMTRLKNTMDSLTIAFADILEPVVTPLMETLVPVVKFLAIILKNTIIPLFKLAAFPVVELAKVLQRWVGGLQDAKKETSEIANRFKQFFSFFDGEVGYWLKIAAGAGLLYGIVFGKFGLGTIMDMIKSPFKAIGKLASKIPGIGGMFGKKDTVPEEATKGIESAGKSAKSAPSGDGVKSFLKNLAAGLKEMGNAKVLFGAINLVPASVGLLAITPSAILSSAIKGNNKLKSFFKDLADGLKEMASGKVLFGAINLIPASIGLLAITPSAILSSVIKGSGKLTSFFKDLAEGLREMASGKVLFGAINLIPASIGLMAIIPSAILSSLIRGGGKLKSFFTDLSEGLKEMASGKVLFGALNLIPVSIGLITLIPGAIMAAILGAIGKPIELGLKFLAKGIGHMGSTQVLKGALGIALVGASIIPFAFAMTMFSEVDWGKVGIGALALVGFTAAAFGLGLLLASGAGAVIFTAGVIGIAALGAALIPFGVAAIAAGFGIKMLGEGISTSVDPILKLASINLLTTAAGITALSVALAAFGGGSAAAGMGSFVGNLLGGDPIKKMEQLAAVGDKLKITADSISQISVATSQFSAMNSFSDAIVKLSESLNTLNKSINGFNFEGLKTISKTATTTAPTTNTPTETKPTTTTPTATGVEAKLDTLINLMREGYIIATVDVDKLSSKVARTAGT